MRTIQHPGVELNEIDLSQVAPAIAGTTCLLAGFADRGEETEPMAFTSRNAFLNYFGPPTNEAEYYFYYAANEVLQQNGGLIASRLPYDNDSKDKFRVQTYTLDTATAWGDTPVSAEFYDTEGEGMSGFVKIYDDGTPSTIATSTVDKYRTGALAAGTNDLIVINKVRDSLKTTSKGDEHGGLFTTIVTPYNALANQRLVDFNSASDPYPGWNVLADISDTVGAPLFTSELSGSYATPIMNNFAKPSVSKELGALFPVIPYNERGEIDNYYLHQVMIVVCKTFEDTNNDNKIGVQVLEAHLGSLNKTAIDASTGESIYIGEIVNNASELIEVYSNIQAGALPGNGYMYKYSEGGGNLLSFTAAETAKTIMYTDITAGLQTTFDKTSNIDEYMIDIVIDGGISTISEMVIDGETFDPTVYNETNDLITERAHVDKWRTICGEYIDFAQSTRKDCISLIDGPRNLVLQGNEKIERASAPSQLIDTNVLTKMKFIGGLNSSYGTGNIMWNKVINEFNGIATWVPPSCKIAGVMIYTDRTANYWDAPAGLNRGVLYGVSDIAFNPKPGQMDQIYNKAWNYAKNYPLDGIVLEGQKTLQVKPSAFDRVNVRRLFLRLERLAYQVLRYFVYQPNNYFTRTQILDVLTPTFEDVKMRGGLYDYRIVCSEKNNTPSVIDRNELKLAIMLKPTKTAEFILCDFYALRTGASFDEVIL